MDNDFDSYESDIDYLFWLIDYWCISHKDLKKIIKFVEDITEEYHG